MRNNHRFPLTAAAALVIGVLFIGSFVASAECDPSTAWDSYPKLPMACNPIHVWIDGELAPVGTYITFSGENVRGEGYLYTTEVGGCGEWSPVTAKLLIQGSQSPDKCGMLNVPDGAPITFYVNGITAQVRIYKDAGMPYADIRTLTNDPDTIWHDSLAFVDGSTYNIELKTGDIIPAPIVEPIMTEPCPKWDRNNVRWTDKDRYWIEHWKENPDTEFLAETFEHLAADWFVPVYRHEQTVEAYQRMVFFADHGGYGCIPNLTAMVEAQGWQIMHTSYGWPYRIGGGVDPDYRWSRIGAMDSGINHLPSLFCPPLDHPVLVENGYGLSEPEPEPEPESPPVLFMTSRVAAEVVDPTPVPTTIPITPIPTTIPTVAPVTQTFTGDITMPKIPMSVSCAGITLGGNPAPAGTVVTATGANVYSGSSVTLEQVGSWDENNPLVIQGTPVKGQGQYAVPEGSPLLFSAGGIPLKVRLFGTTTWQDFIPYSSGSAMVVELASGRSPAPRVQTYVYEGSDTEYPPVIPTPTPSTAPKRSVSVATVTLEPTAEVTTVATPVPTYTPSGKTYVAPVTFKEYALEPAPDNVAVYYSNMPLPDCDDDAPYVPAGYGMLRVSAGSSNGQFYLNDALITNGGVTIIKGVVPGNYVITYRERYYQSEQFPVNIRPGVVTNIEVSPEGPGLLGIIGWPPDWLLDTAPSLSENVDFWYEDLPDPKPQTTGSFQVMTWWDGTDIFLDGQFFIAECDIPCDFILNDISPGIHHITYVTGQYESTFPVIIGAGTLTKIGGGAAIQGTDGDGQYIPMNPWDLYEGPV